MKPGFSGDCDLAYIRTYLSKTTGRRPLVLLNSQYWELGVCVAMCQVGQDSVVAYSLPFSKCTLFINVLGRYHHRLQITEWSGGGTGGSNSYVFQEDLCHAQKTL